MRLINRDGTAERNYSSVDCQGVINASNGVRLNPPSSTAQPTCNSTNQGMLWTVQGTPDQQQACLQTATSGTYAWVPLSNTETSFALTGFSFNSAVNGGQTNSLTPIRNITLDEIEVATGLAPVGCTTSPSHLFTSLTSRLRAPSL
jgi:hypothetical protein